MEIIINIKTTYIITNDDAHIQHNNTNNNQILVFNTNNKTKNDKHLKMKLNINN